MHADVTKNVATGNLGGDRKAFSSDTLTFNDSLVICSYLNSMASIQSSKKCLSACVIFSICLGYPQHRGHSLQAGGAALQTKAQNNPLTYYLYLLASCLIKIEKPELAKCVCHKDMLQGSCFYKLTVSFNKRNTKALFTQVRL